MEDIFQIIFIIYLLKVEKRFTLSPFRVPLLCECCAEVASNAFQEAASRASHMMQMQEMERLRQILERHVSSHLDINWVISTSRLSGSVPVGPLLSSVALLKQLVIPVISIGLYAF